MSNKSIGEILDSEDKVNTVVINKLMPIFRVEIINPDSWSFDNLEYCDIFFRRLSKTAQPIMVVWKISFDRKLNTFSPK